MKNLAPPKPARPAPPQVKPWRPTPAGRPQAPENQRPQQGGRWKAKELNDRDQLILAAMERMVETTVDSRRILKRQLEAEQAKGDFLILAAIWAFILCAVVWLAGLSFMNAIVDSPAGRFFGLRGSGDQTEQVQKGGGDYASPIAGKSLQDLVDYKPSHGQSFGPETGNMRSYGPHGGVDFDCRVGGCAGADVASSIAGKVTQVRKIGTSANGGSYQMHIVGQDWNGEIEHQLVHVDSLKVGPGDRVTAGQLVAKVSPTDSVSTGPHFDWKIVRGGQWVNPQTWAREAMSKASASGGGGGDGMQKAIVLIKQFEGFHPTPYSDYAQCSWGYGTNAGGHPSNCPNITITREQAAAELVAYLERNCVPLLQPLGVNSNQWAALASKCYNLGPGQLRGSRTYQAAARGDMAAAAQSFDDPKWMNAGGERLPGLVSRRAKEKAVFLSR